MKIGLKEQVKQNKLTAAAALKKLEKGDFLAKSCKTYKWLINRTLQKTAQA